MPPSLAERLRKAGIRHYNELIHDQKKDWLVKNFKAEGAAPAYPVNVSRLMRNLVWQMKERIAAGEKEFNELVRTYWYMYVKSTLTRADSLSAETDQYKQLTENITAMVKDFLLMSYKDIGFRDENEANKKIGVNANIIPFSEKLGHFGYYATNKKRDVVIKQLNQQSFREQYKDNLEQFKENLKQANDRFTQEGRIHLSLKQRNIIQAIAFQKVKGIDSLILVRAAPGSSPNPGSYRIPISAAA